MSITRRDAALHAAAVVINSNPDATAEDILAKARETYPKTAVTLADANSARRTITAHYHGQPVSR